MRPTDLRRRAQRQHVALARDVRAPGRLRPSFGRFRREDWELGHAGALPAGSEIVYEPGAVARARVHRLIDAGRAGRTPAARAHGDALLLARYPAALPSLPAAGWPRELAHGRTAPLLLLLRSARLRRAIVPALEALEWARARRLWQRSSCSPTSPPMTLGSAPAAGGEVACPVLLVELTSDEPLPPPAVVAPIIEVRLRGRRVSSFRPEEGRSSARCRSASHARCPGGRGTRWHKPARTATAIRTCRA